MSSEELHAPTTVLQLTQDASNQLFRSRTAVKVGKSSTPCSRAVEILAGIGNEANEEDMCAELGCTPEADCEIDDLRLFEMLDK